MRSLLVPSLLALASSAVAQDFAFPPFSGPYPVATIDIEAAVTPRNISDATYANTSNPVFLLETVLFTTYYPTNQGQKASAAPHTWIPQPFDVVAKGFSDYLKIQSGKSLDPALIIAGLGAFANGIVVPALVDVPLATPNGGKTPVVIFSHGDAASAYWYSNVLGELASYGYFVASIVHRDGSTPGTQVLSSDGTVLRNITYLGTDMIQPQMNFTQLKYTERQFRHAEVFEVIKVLQNITNGDGDAVYKANPRKEGSDLKNWKGKLDLDRVVMSGHSFGGATVLDVLELASNNSAEIYAALVFDPARESGLLPSTQTRPICIADSQEWSGNSTGFIGGDHFKTVKGYAENALKSGLAGWFMTLVGAAHISVTDAPLLPPDLSSFFPSDSFTATIDSSTGIDQYQKLAVEFMVYIQNGTRTDILNAPAAFPQWNQSDQAALDKTPDDVKKFWEIHAAPADGANITLPGGPEDTGGNSSGNGNGNGNGGGDSGKPKPNAAVSRFAVEWATLGSAALVAVSMLFL